MSNKTVARLKKIQASEYDTLKMDEILQDAEVLLLNAHDEDTRTLEKLGLDHQLEYERTHKDDYRRTKKAEEVYATNSFTGAQIRKLCNLYHLKLLPARLYNGSIPAHLSRTVREFAEKNDINIESNNFFILAPVNQFKTIQHVPVRKDPILFYRDAGKESRGREQADEKDVFVQVTNWGNDFTEWRKWLFLGNTFTEKSDDMSIGGVNAAALIVIAGALIIAFWLNFFIFPMILLALAALMIGGNIADGKGGYYETWNNAKVSG